MGTVTVCTMRSTVTVCTICVLIDVLLTENNCCCVFVNMDWDELYMVINYTLLMKKKIIQIIVCCFFFLVTVRDCGMSWHAFFIHDLWFLLGSMISCREYYCNYTSVIIYLPADDPNIQHAGIEYDRVILLSCYLAILLPCYNMVLSTCHLVDETQVKHVVYWIGVS